MKVVNNATLTEFLYPLGNSRLNESFDETVIEQVTKQRFGVPIGPHFVASFDTKVFS